MSIINQLTFTRIKCGTCNYYGSGPKKTRVCVYNPPVVLTKISFFGSKEICVYPTVNNTMTCSKHSELKK